MTEAGGALDRHEIDQARTSAPLRTSRPAQGLRSMAGHQLRLGQRDPVRGLSRAVVEAPSSPNPGLRGVDNPWIHRGPDGGDPVDPSWVDRGLLEDAGEPLDGRGERARSPRPVHSENGVFPRPWTAHKPPRSLELRLAEAPPSTAERPLDEEEESLLGTGGGEPPQRVSSPRTPDRLPSNP